MPHNKLLVSGPGCHVRSWLLRCHSPLFGSCTISVHDTTLSFSAPSSSHRPGDLVCIYHELKSIELRTLNRERSEMLVERWLSTGEVASAAVVRACVHACVSEYMCSWVNFCGFGCACACACVLARVLVCMCACLSLSVPVCSHV